MTASERDALVARVRAAMPRFHVRDETAMLAGVTAGDLRALCAEVERLTREREEAHGLLGKLEWSGSKQCQYSGFARACPSCGGVDPTDECNASSFIASALGHRVGCPLHAARTTGGRDV